ncbi:MAG: transcriptional regulator [Alphaproteobacteria bacterium]|nr:MAG: transcriptional regulator [Alphaproteobacteria bacterium]
MTEASNRDDSTDARMQMVADIVTAYVSHNPVPASSLSDVIRSVHETLEKLESEGGESGPTRQKPAVPVKKSVTDDYIICLEDGKKLKMLKRYLRSHYGLTPEEYRAKWNLPPDYPMVAPSYAAKRSQFAKQIGLGRGSKGRRKKAS